MNFCSMQLDGMSLFSFGGGEVLSIGGVDCKNRECHYVPEFADHSNEIEMKRLGAVERYAEGSDTGCIESCPEKVFTLNGYDYYYESPQVLKSTTQDEKEWEMSTVKLIQEILSNPENYSKI